ncbi:hypothetical protein M513_08710 [Trichuris suis]|uniref:Uncharacterized protein n=1 Tax=Trichuris suis TaxID=68888 RepID=A0A085LZT7_9BILA|nr:hypothetical protein M513_08710 [Trichuris suis]
MIDLTNGLGYPLAVKPWTDEDCLSVTGKFPQGSDGENIVYVSFEKDCDIRGAYVGVPVKMTPAVR